MDRNPLDDAEGWFAVGAGCYLEVRLTEFGWAYALQLPGFEDAGLHDSAELAEGAALRVIRRIARDHRKEAAGWLKWAGKPRKAKGPYIRGRKGLLWELL